MKICDLITKLQDIEDTRGSDAIVYVAMPDLGEIVTVKAVTVHETKAGEVKVVLK